MLITVWMRIGLSLPDFSYSHDSEPLHRFKGAETGMNPVGAPFFSSVCKLLVIILTHCVTRIIHNQKSEPSKIRMINTLPQAKYMDYLSLCSLSRFGQGISTEQFILFSYSV